MTVYRRQPSNLAAPSLHTHSFDDVDVPGDWVDSALCATTNPALFYMGTGESYAPAKKVCARCPVTVACLDYAIAYESRYDTPGPEGVYGGLSPRERRLLIAQRRGRAS